MRIAAVNKKVSAFLQEDIKKCVDADILLFSFGCSREVDLAVESGTSGVICELAAVSEHLNCVLVAGIYTDLFGTKRKSIMVCDAGRLLGISDETLCEEGGIYTPGYGYRVYDTAVGLIGAVVGSDVEQPNAVGVITNACGNSFISITDACAESVENAFIGNCRLYRIGGICLAENGFLLGSRTGDLAKFQGEFVMTEFSPRCAYKNLLSKYRR